MFRELMRFNADGKLWWLVIGLVLMGAADCTNKIKGCRAQSAAEATP